jgi:hypothetical protein
MDSKTTFKVDKCEAETYVARGKWGHRCYITLVGDGTVLVSSPSHDYYGSYCWPEAHRAETDLVKFLAGCDKQYLCKKLFANRYKEFDYEKTMSEIRKDIIRCRRDGTYSAKEARTYWDELDEVEAAGIWSSEHVCNTSTMDCVYEMFVYENSTNIRDFWDDIWVPFIGQLYPKKVSDTA